MKSLAKALLDSRRAAARSGTPQNQVVKFPLVVAGQSIGELWAATRAPDESFSSIDLRLIGNLPNIYLYAANNPSEGLIAKPVMKGFKALLGAAMPRSEVAS